MKYMVQIFVWLAGECTPVPPPEATPMLAIHSAFLINGKYEFQWKVWVLNRAQTHTCFTVQSTLCTLYSIRIFMWLYATVNWLHKCTVLRTRARRRARAQAKYIPTFSQFSARNLVLPFYGDQRSRCLLYTLVTY